MIDLGRANRGINFSNESRCSLSWYWEPGEQELIAIAPRGEAGIRFKNYGVSPTTARCCYLA